MMPQSPKTPSWNPSGETRYWNLKVPSLRMMSWKFIPDIIVLP